MLELKAGTAMSSFYIFDMYVCMFKSVFTYMKGCQKPTSGIFIILHVLVWHRVSFWTCILLIPTDMNRRDPSVFALCPKVLGLKALATILRIFFCMVAGDQCLKIKCFTNWAIFQLFKASWEWLFLIYFSSAGWVGNMRKAAQKWGHSSSGVLTSFWLLR